MYRIIKKPRDLFFGNTLTERHNVMNDISLQVNDHWLKTNTAPFNEMKDRQLLMLQRLCPNGVDFFRKPQPLVSTNGQCCVATLKWETFKASQMQSL